MKNLFLCSLLAASVAAGAQQKKAAPAQKPAPKPAAQTQPLKNMMDSASYAIGLSVANQYKQMSDFLREQGVTKVDTAMVLRGITDGIKAKKTLMTDNDANTVIMNYLSKAQASKAQPNIEAGQKFLAANKAKAGVKTTASGLQYEVIKEGTGPRPTAQDTVICNYAGTLLNGTEFDNSYKRGQPLTIGASQVIRGWTEALQLMPVGSKYKFYIPYELGYGTNDMGQIPAGSLLIFELELLGIKGK